MKYPQFLLIGIFLFTSVALKAQTSLPNTLLAEKIDSEIIVDGVLDEPIWDRVQKVSNFTQWELYEGEPSSEKTQVAILYDSTHLYIGVWAYDSEPEKITAQEMSHDFSWQMDDNFQVIFSPFNDNRNGFLFVVNPNGAYADAIITDEGAGNNKDWNGLWQVRTTITNEGWFAELEIELSSLKFPESKEQIWGMNLKRNISRKCEQVLWQGWARNSRFLKISQAGKLIGLNNIENGNNLEIKPFISGGVGKNSGEEWKNKIKIGGDINYLLNTTLKLSLTFNTDFSQVESDKAQINLSRFSMSYPEQREFFLESKDQFELNLGEKANIFYSRRIGINDNGEEVPILVGARLAGKANMTNVGIMSIQTGQKGDIPSTNYSIIRIKQDVLGQSNVGVILTSKYSSNGDYNYVYGIDANYVTSNLFGNKNLSIGGILSQSTEKEKSGKNDMAYKAYLSYPNDFVKYDMSVTTINNDFNPGVGFLDRKNYTEYYTELQFNPRPSFLPWVKNLEIKPIEWHYFLTDDTKQKESLFMEFRPLAVVGTSGDKIEFNIQRFYDRLDESFELFSNALIPSGMYWYNRSELMFESYGGREVGIGTKYSWGQFYTGQSKELELSLNWNVTKNFKMSADWEKNSISLNNNNYSVHEIGAHLKYAFNPNLFTSLFSQWNNEDEEIILNFRVNWLPKPGSYVYFVINQQLSTENKKFKLQSTSIMAKIIWLI